MSEHRLFKVRLRVLMGKSLTSDQTVLRVAVDGQNVEIKSQKVDEPLRHAKWVLFISGGFTSEPAARLFGERLKSIVSIAGVCTRNGIDVGEDRATSQMSQDWAREVGLIGQDDRMHPNVHGLLIHPDDGLSRFLNIHGSGVVTSDPVSFLGAIEELGRAVPLPSVTASAAVRILNLALKSAEPLTQVVLAISVVEALGQDEKWTENQKEMLSGLARSAEKDESVEGKEVADAVRRGMHRIGLRQGVLRVLSRLGLEDLKKDWDRLYKDRSGVFHGTQQLAEHEMHDLAQSALTLCGRIVVALLRRDGVTIPTVTKMNYPDRAKQATENT